MATTMLPTAEVLPDVLPTDRLLVSGKAVPELRNDLRRIAGFRNAITVVVLWAQIVGILALAVWVANPFAWLAVLIVFGAYHARVAILGHEAAHRLLFANKKVNDFVGKWLLSYPGFVPFDLYRRSHFAHHKEEFGPNEPDLNLYNGYPITRASLRRKLTRDARGTSGWKSLKGLLRGLSSSLARPVALRILAAQAVLALLCTLVGRPELYLLWFGSWMTSWRVINRLRAIAEHGGMTRSPDRRLTTHHVRQTWPARFWIVPYNTGWHLAHHVDMGVPWRNLPAFHRELEAAGWITPGLEHPSYTALWRKLSRG
ncbi:MAG: fatty acid desaturase family protein [Acidimicrobiia bacterium]|nr:fatty acid desaturase family protein [Acidimicrobiia bacterium]